MVSFCVLLNGLMSCSLEDGRVITNTLTIRGSEMVRVAVCTAIQKVYKKNNNSFLG